jgi:hypothetical protein
MIVDVWTPVRTNSSPEALHVRPHGDAPACRRAAATIHAHLVRVEYGQRAVSGWS